MTTVRKTTNSNACVRPDLLIALGVHLADIRKGLPNSWIRETGKASGFVTEVASPSTATNDLERKLDLYVRLGVAEYRRFDLTGGHMYGLLLTGDRLVGGQSIADQTHPINWSGDARTHTCVGQAIPPLASAISSTTSKERHHAIRLGHRGHRLAR